MVICAGDHLDTYFVKQRVQLSGIIQEMCISSSTVLLFASTPRQTGIRLIQITSEAITTAHPPSEASKGTYYGTSLVIISLQEPKGVSIFSIS